MNLFCMVSKKTLYKVYEAEAQTKFSNTKNGCKWSNLFLQHMQKHQLENQKPSFKASDLNIINRFQSPIRKLTEQMLFIDIQSKFSSGLK